jgi:hypothetical protein
MERNVNHHHKQPSQSLLNQTLKATSFLPTAKMRFSALNLLALASSAAAFSGQISDWLDQPMKAVTTTGACRAQDKKLGK